MKYSVVVNGKTVAENLANHQEASRAAVKALSTAPIGTVAETFLGDKLWQTTTVKLGRSNNRRYIPKPRW